ncbi:hypothetical protein LCGC14_1108660, partial [marine sediment metagenome]
MLLLAQANAFQIPLPDKSVHMGVTSPPYYSLRKYSGEQEFIFGGDKDCVHEWFGAEIKDENYTSRKRWQHGHTRKSNPDGWETTAQLHGGSCTKCNAWRGAYGLEPTLQMYIDHTVEWCREVWRVLRDDATFWLNLGDSYAGSGGAGGDYNEGGLREGQPKYPGTNRSTGFAQQNSPHKSGQQNSRRAGKQLDLKPKDLMGVPWRVALALQADGWYLRSDIIWHKPNPMPESVTDRPTKAHEYLFLLTKSKKYYYDADAIREPSKDWGLRNRDNEKRYSEGVMPNGQPHAGLRDNDFSERGRNKRSVWTMATAPYSGAHFATYPPALVETCIKAGVSEKGVCPECGNPWERTVEKIAMKIRRSERTHKLGRTRSSGTMEKPAMSKTLGWRPVCKHYD